MKILEKRPLALILCIMLGGFSFFADFKWGVRLIIAAVALLTIGIIYISDTLKEGRKVIVLISLIAFSLSLVLSVIWSSVFYPNRLYDSRAEIEGKIYDIDNSDSATSVMLCKTKRINGKRNKHTFIVYVDKEIAVRISEYDAVAFTAEINELSSSDDGFDGRSYYVANGYSALCTDVSDLNVGENKVDRIDLMLDSMRLKISNRLKMRTDFDTGAFLAALIVGDRSDLSGSTRLNFARLGISHILALSGMHLAILSAALNFLLIKLGVNKKIRVAVLAVLVVFYMGITGFSASVVRSGFMLIISGVLYLLSRKSDAITSLTIAISLIVLIKPESVYDMSLWLSAFATLGVIVFAEISEKPDKFASKWYKVWLWFKNACLVSVFAISATFALTALRFDYFSVVSVFTTLIFSFVIQFFIYGGLLLLLLGGIIPFGKIIVFFSNAILGLAEWISSSKLVYVPMHSVMTKMLAALLAVFFFAFLVLEIKNKKRCACIILILLISVFAVGETDALIHRYSDDVIYAPNKSGDVVILKSDGDLTAIYSGKAYTDGAFDILDCFTDERISYVDNLVFVSYSYTTIDFIKAIIDNVKVERIMLPRPTTDDEIAQVEGLSYLLSGYGTTMECYDIVEYLYFGEYRYSLFEKVDYVYGEYPSNVYQLVVGEEKYTYLSPCKYSSLSASARALVWNSENLIIGTVGNSNYYIFDMRIESIKEISYFDDGRLSDGASEYYKNNGASVRCTKTPFSLLD